MRRPSQKSQNIRKCLFFPTGFSNFSVECRDLRGIKDFPYLIACTCTYSAHMRKGADFFVIQLLFPLILT